MMYSPKVHFHFNFDLDLANPAPIFLKTSPQASSPLAVSTSSGYSELGIKSMFGNGQHMKQRISFHSFEMA